MNKKKISLIIIILLLILLIISIFFINKISNKTTIDSNNKTTTTLRKTSKEISSSTTNTTTVIDSNTRTSTTVTTKATTTTTIKTTTTTKRQTTKETTTTTTTKKPSCPDGFTLENNKCTKTIDAVKTCPPNMADVGGEDIPQDEYCINLSEGYETTDLTCPDNYTMMKIITIGSPDKYRCIPLHKKEYKCEDGYTLHDTNKCTISINPQ